MNRLELTGRTESHILRNPDFNLIAERETTSAYLEMKKEAEKAGIFLSAYSSFRSFNDQMGIWNAKCSGKRPLFDREGKLLKVDELSTFECIQSILIWSALPGASRHHWGTEIDVIDLGALPENYKVQLMPEEFGDQGVFHSLNHWLDKHLQQFGFFKPYREYNGGVSEEPWHISYAPVSKKLIDQLTVELVEEAIRESEMMCKEAVLENLPEFFERYVLNVCD